MIAPAEFEHTLGHLTEFNTSCTPGFVQAGGQLALRDGEDDLSVLRQRIQTGYKITANALTSFSKVDFIEPDGAFYVFFRVEGLTDSFSAAMDILSKTKVGLAPGIAFGQQGEGYLRMCFAQPKAILEEAFERLQPVLE